MSTTHLVCRCWQLACTVYPVLFDPHGLSAVTDAIIMPGPTFDGILVHLGMTSQHNASQQIWVDYGKIMKAML